MLHVAVCIFSATFHFKVSMSARVSKEMLKEVLATLLFLCRKLFSPENHIIQ